MIHAVNLSGGEARQYRLLYRGSLSLPDSEVVLDGITFVAEIFPSSPSRLLDCPIALALESMRGRPSLRFISVIKTPDINFECVEAIHMYIHPRSTMARRFFENTLCSEKLNENNFTQHAVRLGLGDGHGADDTDILILGRLSPSQASLKLLVGCILPEQSSTGKRKPRPDDPAPRIPVSFVPLKKPSQPRKRPYQFSSDDTQLKRVKVDKSQEKKRTLMANEPHVCQSDTNDSNKIHVKHKRSSHTICDQEKHTSFDGPGDIEIANRAVMKRITVDALSQRGVSKDHPEFRDIFNHTIHSIGFVLRRDIKMQMQIDTEEISRLVDVHIKMYLDGLKWLKDFDSGVR